MFDVAHLFNLFGQYGETSRDFLIRVRPRQFAHVIRNKEHGYLKPFQFLVISLVISSVCAFTVAALLLAGPDRDALFHLGILGCLAIVVGMWLENLIVIVAAKLAAFALGISAPLSDLLDGYCYASILFPLFIVATELIVLGPEQPSVSAVVVLALVQILFFGLACVAMTRFVSMHPRYTWRVSVGTFLIMLVSSCLVLDTIDQIDNPDSYVAHPLAAARDRLGSSFLAPSQFTVPECDSATLNGHVRVNEIHDEVTVWFEWGSTPTLGHITITQRFTSNVAYYQKLVGLKENTKYSYRTVGSSKNGSFRGRLFSFTTGHC